METHSLQAVCPALAEPVQPSLVEACNVVHDGISLNCKGRVRHPLHIQLQRRVRPMRPGSAAYPSLDLLPVCEAQGTSARGILSFSMAWCSRFQGIYNSAYLVKRAPLDVHIINISQGGSY